MTSSSSLGGTVGLTLLTAVAPLSWGTTYLVTTEFLPTGFPVMSAVIRALPAGLILLALTRRLPQGGWWWRAAALGALNISAFNALLFVAAYRLPGGVAATLNAVQPLFVVGLAAAVLGERPTSWRLGWSLAGVVGVGLMVLQGRFATDMVGLAAGFAAAAAMAAGIVLTKRWGRPEGVGVAAIAAWQLAAGGLLLAPAGIVLEGLPVIDARTAGGYLWLGAVGALMAYVVWFRGIARLQVVAVSFLTLLSPVVATALGWLVLGEALTPWQGVGFTIALTAVVAAQLPARVLPRRPRSAPPSAGAHGK